MKKYIRNLSVPIPSDIISKAHEIYKTQEGRYGLTGRFNNKYGNAVLDSEKFDQILFELAPKSFRKVTEIKSNFWK